MSQSFVVTSRLRLPKDDAFGRVIPKSKIYRYGGAGKKLKELFVRYVEKIIHTSILTTKTVNLPAKAYVKEIHVLSIILRRKELPTSVLEAIDRAVAYPTVFICCYESRIQYAASYKRPSESDKSKWVTSEYFFSDWFKSDSSEQDLPLALDLQSIYEQLIAALIKLQNRPGETIEKLAERVQILRIKQGQVDKLQNKVHKEKQYNRKVELNRELKQIKREIERLK